MSSTIWSRSTRPYGIGHSRQILTLCLPKNPPATNTKSFWIIYVHGGAWRDPRQTHRDFDATLDLIANNFDDAYSSILAHVAGFASIDYGLSPHPDFPNSDPAYSVRHPQHVQDVCTALAWLAAEYGVGRPNGEGSGYVLVGHSAGSTIAMQIAMGIAETREVENPVAVVGLAGIYDIPQFVRHPKSPEWAGVYRNIVLGAFGEDDEEWRKASPALRGDLLEKMKSGRSKVVLSHSVLDELVDIEQTMKMYRLLRDHQLDVRRPLTPRSKHDESWQKGYDIVQAIQVVVNTLVNDRSTF
jgi:kynurenine formamidase